MPVAADRPKRQAVSASTLSHSTVTARPVSAPAPTTLSASTWSMPVTGPRRRACSIRLAALLASPASRRTWRRSAAAPWLHLAIFSRSGHSAPGSAEASALCTATWVILGVKSDDVDAGDQHRRRIGLAHPQQQPGALGDPVDRMHRRRRRRSAPAGRCAARCAASGSAAACRAGASARTGSRRARRPTARPQGPTGPDRSRPPAADRAATRRDLDRRQRLGQPRQFLLAEAFAFDHRRALAGTGGAAAGSPRRAAVGRLLVACVLAARARAPASLKPGGSRLFLRQRERRNRRQRRARRSAAGA
jgi:hypothetical protein